MMKKMVSMAMAAVMAATLMVAVAPAAEVNASETTVSYNFTEEDSTIEGEDYLVVVPSTISFDNATSVDATVSIVDKDTKGEYTGASKVTVSVTSLNGYQLVSGTNAVDYSLAYKGTAGYSDMVTMNGIVGNLGSGAESTIPGTATLTGTATVTGSYIDTLTYKVAPATQQ